MNIVYIDTPTFNSLDGKYSADKITYTGTIRGTAMVRGIEYVITAIYNGTQKEYQGFPVVDLADYTGELEPLSHEDSVRAINLGTRSRSYAGTMVTYRDRTLVMTEPRTQFIHQPANQQLSLF